MSNSKCLSNLFKITVLCLIVIHFFSSELNDPSPSDVIDGEVPELLKAILAQDSNVFKGAGFSNAGASKWL